MSFVESDSDWFHKPFRTHASRQVPDKYRHIAIPAFLYSKDGIWMRRYKWRTAKRRNERPGPTAFPVWKMRRALSNHVARLAQRPKGCAPSEHDWNNEGNDPTECLRCGMSFSRHIFTECP